MAGQPRLLIAAHGTTSAAGAATVTAIVAAVAASRPDLDVSLCFLDVGPPSLRTALDSTPGPVVVVPLLLSAGYHVLTDIPSAVRDRRGVGVAGHLGADPAVVAALYDRLLEARGPLAPRSTALAAVESSRPSARAEVAAAAAQLATRLGRPVEVLALSDGAAARLRARPGPVEVATYLLAEGTFLDRLRAAAEGLAVVAGPIGAHPRLVELLSARYDAAVNRSGTPCV